MLKRPDEDFVKLREALVELGQEHVLMYLEPSPVDRTDQAEELSLSSQARTDFSQDYVRGWKTLLVSNRTKLVDGLDVSDQLMTDLMNFGVINMTFNEFLKVS